MKKLLFIITLCAASLTIHANIMPIAWEKQNESSLKFLSDQTKKFAEFSKKELFKAQIAARTTIGKLKDLKTFGTLYPTDMERVKYEYENRNNLKIEKGLTDIQRKKAIEENNINKALAEHAYREAQLTEKIKTHTNVVTPFNAPLSAEKNVDIILQKLTVELNEKVNALADVTKNIQFFDGDLEETKEWLNKFKDVYKLAEQIDSLNWSYKSTLRAEIKIYDAATKEDSDWYRSSGELKSLKNELLRKLHKHENCEEMLHFLKKKELNWLPQTKGLLENMLSKKQLEEDANAAKPGFFERLKSIFSIDNPERENSSETSESTKTNNKPDRNYQPFIPYMPRNQ